MKQNWMRLLCLFNFFCEILTSETDVKIGDLVAATLLDPIVLSHQATHNIQTKPTAAAAVAVPSRIRRPLTPGPGVIPRFLSPMPEKRVLTIEPNELVGSGKNEAHRRNRYSVVVETPSIPRRHLKPLTDTPSTEISTSHKPRFHSSIPLEDFYDELTAAIVDENILIFSKMVSRPEMSRLEVNQLKELLFTAHESSLGSAKHVSVELFHDLFVLVVTKLVPKHHPRSFIQFVMLAVNPLVLPRLASKAFKHLNLITLKELNDLIREIEAIYIKRKIVKGGKPAFDRFISLIMEIAFNLERTETLMELPHINEVFALTAAGPKSTANFLHKRVLNQLKLAYFSTSLVYRLKSIKSSHTAEEITDFIKEYFDIAQKELSLSTCTILESINHVLKIVLPHVKEEQFEALERFLKALQKEILNHNDLLTIPSEMKENQDLYIYFVNDFLFLAKARLKFYRSSKLTKLQVITLLNAIEILNYGNTHEFMLALLSTVNIPRTLMSESDWDSLQPKSKLLLKGSLTIPPRYRGAICTDNRVFQHAHSVNWDLPKDLFLEDPVDIDGSADILFELPRLFLFKVFGIPLNEFTKVNNYMEELPEAQELLDTANFFVERWCSIHEGSDPYPAVKIEFPEEEEDDGDDDELDV